MHTRATALLLAMLAGCGIDPNTPPPPVDAKVAQPGDTVKSDHGVGVVISTTGCVNAVRDPTWGSDAGTEAYLTSDRLEPASGWNGYNGAQQATSASVKLPWIWRTPIVGKTAIPDPKKRQWTWFVTCDTVPHTFTFDGKPGFVLPVSGAYLVIQVP